MGRSAQRPGARAPEDAVVERLMKRDFITLPLTANQLSAHQLMRLARVRQLPVVQGGALVGVLSHRDLLELALAQLEAQVSAQRVRELRSGPIEAVLRRSPVTVGPRDPAGVAAALMRRHHIGCLPVVDATQGAAQLLGLVTEGDLLRAAYEPSETPD